MRCEALLSAGMTSSVMTRLRWVWIALAFLAVMTLSCGTVAAADKTKVDQATKRVERGAKMIGKGQGGPGFKEMFEGIGQSLVEGLKFSHQNIKEFVTGKKSV